MPLGTVALIVNTWRQEFHLCTLIGNVFVGRESISLETGLTSWEQMYFSISDLTLLEKGPPTFYGITLGNSELYWEGLSPTALNLLEVLEGKENPLKDYLLESIG